MPPQKERRIQKHIIISIVYKQNYLKINCENSSPKVSCYNDDSTSKVYVNSIMPSFNIHYILGDNFLGFDKYEIRLLHNKQCTMVTVRLHKGNQNKLWKIISYDLEQMHEHFMTTEINNLNFVILWMKQKLQNTA